MNDVTPLCLQVANEALSIINSNPQTTYTDNIYIDPATGTYDVDCSGFVSWVLGQVAPNHLDMIQPSGTETRLHAQDYYNFFSGLPLTDANGWWQIAALADAGRGDLIAWALPPSSGSTGHVFIVAEQPVALDSSTMAVPAYDASDVLHYDDSRYLGPGQQQTGVGSGTFHLQIQLPGTGQTQPSGAPAPPPGAPIAFQFGPGDQFFSDSIAIAHIELFDA
jgi:hypothetical protein